jgi:putative ABC transport system permease protein
MMRDLLWAVRWLRHNPLFTGAVIAILALGIGANTAVFSIVDAVMLRGSYDSAATLVRIEEQNSRRGIPLEDYQVWNSRSDLFERTAAHLRDVVSVTGVPEPYQVNTQRATAELFPLLGVRARLGRTPSEADILQGNPAVLSDRLWRRAFRADPAIVGRTFTASDEVFTIIGVMPPDFEFPYSDIEMWLPLRLRPGLSRPLDVVARIKPNIPLSQVQGAMRIVATQLERERPQDRTGLQIVVSRWRDNVGQQYESTLVFVLAAVGLVLLIACADVGGLLLSRAVRRQKEIAIRAALGAEFWRVLRQILAESLVLAIVGSAAGLAVAQVALRYLTQYVAALPVVLPHLQRASVNGRVLLFNTALCLVVACLFSIAPVLLSSKTDLQTVLRGAHASGGPKGSARLFAVLIGCETAFAFLLLVGSGLMVRSLLRLQQSDHEWKADHVLTMRVPIGTLTQPRPTGKYDSKPRQMAYYRDILERLRRVPGVAAVAVVNNPPLTSVNTSTFVRGPNGETLQNSTRTISPQYFSAMGIPLVAGRAFTDADESNAPHVAIVNEALARLLYPGRDPLGQDLPSPDTATPPKIVGVVKDTPQRSLERPPGCELYLPYRQAIFGVFMSTVVARTFGDPLSVVGAMRNEVWAVDPNQPIVKVETLNDAIDASIWRPRFSAWVFSVLGGLALLLTSAGVYGVVAYTTALRTREIGIRMALGASPRAVVAVILRGSMVPLATGLAISFAAAMFLSRLLASLLYEVSGTDPLTYAGAAALLLAIGTIASVRPAWKTARADPLAALRTE